MIAFILLVFLITYFGDKVKWLKKLRDKSISQAINSRLLLGLLIIGFVLNLDYTNRFGCIIGDESILDPRNILFSSISISLILLYLVVKSRILKLYFVLLEFSFWIFKLFYFKGGYAVGVLGSPDIIISFYDHLCLFLRLLIIFKLLKLNCKTIYLVLFTLAIMIIKIFLFPIPISGID